MWEQMVETEVTWLKCRSKLVELIVKPVPC